MYNLTPDDILDVAIDPHEPLDNGSNTLGRPTRWVVLCYSPWAQVPGAAKGTHKPHWHRVYRYRHPRQRRTWIELEGRKLQISVATWTAVEARRGVPQPKRSPPTGLKSGDTRERLRRHSVNSEI